MDAQTDAVTGAYLSRVSQPNFVAWEYPGLSSMEYARRGVGVERIGGCGFGCVLARRNVFDRAARSSGDLIGYDCNLWADVNRQGGVVKIDWNILCEHRGAT
jgi:hypothetical protein